MSQRTVFTPLTTEALEYDTIGNYPKENALYYVCGYLMKKCLVQHLCPTCKLYAHEMNEIREETLHTYFIARNTTFEKPFGSLTTPSIHFYEFIKALDQEFCENFEKVALKPRVGFSLKQCLKDVEFTLPCPDFPLDFLVTFFVRVRIFHLVQFVNIEFKSS